jgi:hypothetical protein
MQKGEIMMINTPAAIVADFGKPVWAVRADNMYHLIRDIRAFEGTDSCYAFGEYLHVTLHTDAQKLKDHLKAHKGLIITPAKAGIEDAFMQLMQEQNEAV